MDSLDDYLEKRRQRTLSITASTSKAKQTAERARANMHTIKMAHSVGAKTTKTRTGLFKSTTPHKGVPFVPSVTSTSKMNLNFTAVKTPITFTAKKIAEKKDAEVPTKTESKENIFSQKSGRRSLPQEYKAAPLKKFETPGKVNTTVAHSPVKKFDLKASLARPVTWKPYTGKIKTQYLTGESTEHKDIKVKTPKVQTRDDRRQNHLKNRAAKKDAQQMKRRGLLA